MLAAHSKHCKKTHSALQPEGSRQRLGHTCSYKLLVAPAVRKWQDSSQSQEKETDKLRRKWETIQLASLSVLLLRIFLALLPHAFALPNLQTLPWEFLLLIHVGGFAFSAGISFRAQLCSEVALATTDMDGFKSGLFSYTVWTAWKV